MLRFEDSAAAIDEPKTARMEQRTKAHVKERIQYAAAAVLRRSRARRSSDFRVVL